MSTAGPQVAAQIPLVRSASAPAASDSQPFWEQDLHDAEAERISRLIDEELKKEQQRRKEAKRKEVKVMLLGQAESGKSTLQKQFQLYYASQTIDHERPLWRPIVYFNIIKGVRMALDELESLFAAQASETIEEISTLRTRLLPLTSIETSLAFELSGGISVTGGRSGVFVRGGWQALTLSGRSRSNHDTSTPPNKAVAVTTLAARTLYGSRDDIKTLWWHPLVQTLVKSQKLKLDESAPFFLADVERVSEPDYMPTTDDILNVRLQTLGVTEHVFDINVAGYHNLWRLYDVGGARGQRRAWIPYFDDATAIIFLAPLSAFDQFLEEDLRTNRIEDSLQLFTAICSNQLLKSTHLVLLLNKVDLLKKKLEAGVKVRKYITSYGFRPNRYEDVAEYFRAHFVQVHKKHDISDRSLFVHFTSMLDIKATQEIIINVGEAIIRSHISRTGLA
ncbi:hypothetical protein ONZ45_g9787 [Pleurotus djamor]|nr:hypothetical protein ONZ45_g9787 [Pleurotus djamor]